MASTATFPLSISPISPPASPGGNIPLQPYEDNRTLILRAAPTKDEILEILRRVTPDDYHVPIEQDPRGSIALYRSIACQQATQAKRIYEQQQSCYFLPYPTQGEEPASSLRSATFELVLVRTKDRHEGRIIEIGALDMVGDQGRTYTNQERVEWLPYDTDQTKSILMISENPGAIGNMDHLAQPVTGLLVNDQTGLPATEVLDLAVQGQRTNIGASVVSVPGSLSQIKDSGIPDQFLLTDIGLYIEVVASGVGNEGRILKITGFNDPNIEDPPLSGLRPHFITVDDGPVVQRLNYAASDDGGVVTLEIDQAISNTPDDVTLLPAAPAVNDAYLFGLGVEWDFLEIDISTAGDGDWTLVWEYSAPAATWSPLADVEDETNGFRLLGKNVVRFTKPGDWTLAGSGGITGYLIRARVTAVTTTTDQPLGRTATAYLAQSLTPENGTLEWRMLDWSELGFEIVQMGAPAGGRDDMLRLLGEERGVYQQTNETDDQFRNRAARLADVVSPNSIRRYVNRELAPYGYRGLAIDVEDYDGFFCDIDFCDYYEPGDPAGAPASDYKLLLSEKEAYGWFFVFVPNLNDGTDFGNGYDEGPLGLIGDTQLAPAFDTAIMDGYAVSADQTYRSIYDAVNAARAGGIGFTMIRDESLNVDLCP